MSLILLVHVGIQASKYTHLSWWQCHHDKVKANSVKQLDTLSFTNTLCFTASLSNGLAQYIHNCRNSNISHTRIIIFSSFRENSQVSEANYSLTTKYQEIILWYKQIRVSFIKILMNLIKRLLRNIDQVKKMRTYVKWFQQMNVNWQLCNVG